MKRSIRRLSEDFDLVYCWIVITGLLVSSAVSGQTLTTLHSFSGADGATPQSPLSLSGTSLYGGTMFGGVNGQGTIFKINTNGTGFVTLYEFTDSDVDGNAANPYGPLVVSEGVVYGTASGLPSGTIFKIKSDGSGQSVLHIFSGGLDGDIPMGGLVLSNDTLYGTTFEGGNVFKVNTNGTGFASLHCLSCQANVHTDDTAIRAGLVLVGNWLYGATYGGGSNNAGTLFKIKSDGSEYTTIHEFNGNDGAKPWSGLLSYKDRLYGTTSMGGGSGASGVVFAINPDGTGFTVLHRFTGYEGGFAQGGLIASDNVLYGTVMSGGGIGTAGALFAMNTDGTGFQKLYVFSGGSDGGAPTVGLTMSGNSLYGTTTTGGNQNQGTIFRLDLPAPPSAVIAYLQTKIVLTWPTNISMPSLQSSTNLIDWTAVSALPNVVNGNYTMTNSISGDRQFFRLSR